MRVPKQEALLLRMSSYSVSMNDYHALCIILRQLALLAPDSMLVNATVVRPFSVQRDTSVCVCTRVRAPRVRMLPLFSQPKPRRCEHCTPPLLVHTGRSSSGASRRRGVPNRASALPPALGIAK